jgi:hypothetical protein
MDHDIREFLAFALEEAKRVRDYNREHMFAHECGHINTTLESLYESYFYWRQVLQEEKAIN